MAKYKVKFLPAGTVVEVDPVDFPFGRTGRPGSLLDIALSHGVHIEHACGGSGVCGSCHVGIESGAANLVPADDDEMDQIDQVVGSSINTRLACQAVVKGDVTVTVPSK